MQSLSTLTASLIAENVSPATASILRPVRIPEERILSRAGDQTHSAVPRGTGNAAHSIRADDVALGECGIVFTELCLQLLVGRLLFAAAQRQSQGAQLNRLRNASLFFGLSHEICQSLGTFRNAHDPMVSVWAADNGQSLAALVQNRAFGMCRAAEIEGRNSMSSSPYLNVKVSVSCSSGLSVEFVCENVSKRAIEGNLIV